MSRLKSYKSVKVITNWCHQNSFITVSTSSAYEWERTLYIRKNFIPSRPSSWRPLVAVCHKMHSTLLQNGAKKIWMIISHEYSEILLDSPSNLYVRNQVQLYPKDLKRRKKSNSAEHSMKQIGNHISIVLHALRTWC